MAVSKSRKKKKEEEEAAAAAEAEGAARDLGTTPDAATVETEAEAGMETEATETAPVEMPSMPVLLPKLRVMKEWKGSIRGHITTFTEGKIIDPRGYGGAKGVEALKKAGLVAEEIV